MRKWNFKEMSFQIIVPMMTVRAVSQADCSMLEARRQWRCGRRRGASQPVETLMTITASAFS